VSARSRVKRSVPVFRKTGTDDRRVRSGGQRVPVGEGPSATLRAGRHRLEGCSTADSEGGHRHLACVLTFRNRYWQGVLGACRARLPVVGCPYAAPRRVSSHAPSGRDHESEHEVGSSGEPPSIRVVLSVGGGCDVSPSLLQQASAAGSSAAVAWRFNATTRGANADRNPFRGVSMPHGSSPRGSRTMAEAEEGKPVETG